MISDYSNLYFYPVPSTIKDQNLYPSFQYPMESYDFKEYHSTYISHGYDCPPAACCPTPMTYVPNSFHSPDQDKVDFVDQPLVKYEYQEPEENFISIDELQYNPNLLKMILPHDFEAEKLKQRHKSDNLEKTKLQKLPEMHIKKEPIVEVALQSTSNALQSTSNNVGNIGKDDKQMIKAEPPSLNMVPQSPLKAEIKVERKTIPDKNVANDIPSAHTVKIEPIAIISDSEEEIDENEEGEEFNWMDLEEQEKQDFECCYCRKRVSSNYNLRRHMTIHTGNRPFGCDICLKTFREFSDLKKHRRSHRGDPRYKCMICHEILVNEKDGAKCFPCSQKKISPYGNILLEKLPVIEGEGDNKSFLCPECGRLFGSRHNLRRHYMIHTGAKPYPCDICNKAFREIGTLKKHMLTHSRMKLFKCNICNKDYNGYKAFVRHKNGHGEEWENVNQNPALEDGQSGENDGECLFQCNDCRKRFTDVKLYKKHLKMHSQYFTFQCYICKMIFKKYEKLYSHMVTHSHQVSDSD